jgi:hypothetical protein
MTDLQALNCLPAVCEGLCGLRDARVEWGGDDQSCLVCTACVGDQVVVAHVYVPQERDVAAAAILASTVDPAAVAAPPGRLLTA